MDRSSVYKYVFERMTKNGFLKPDNPLLKCNVKTKQDISYSYVQVLNGTEVMITFAVDYLIAYCGGVNIGAVSSHIKYHRMKYATAVFIAEIIFQASTYKGLVFTTNNNYQLPWCKYIRNLLTPHRQYTTITVHNITNANTGNSIECTMFDSYQLAAKFKRNVYDSASKNIDIINDFIDALIPAPKEESKQPKPDVTNITNNTDPGQPHKVAFVRTPKVRKNNRPQRASELLNN